MYDDSRISIRDHACVMCFKSYSVKFYLPIVFGTIMYDNRIDTTNVGGAVASWLVRSTPDRVVRVRGLAGDIVLRSWARHFTLTVPLSTQVYKWVPA